MDTSASENRPQPAPARLPGPLETARAAVGGALMGIANLIPGVSGGTMILAVGIYQQFIEAVADLSALRFSWRRVLFLGVLGGCAGVAIVALSGVILHLLFHYTIAMFSLFIGLTLGGAPLLYRSLRPLRADVIGAVLAGIALMAGVFMLRTGLGFPKNTLMDFVSGLVGATTMVLPGISGSYMLLVMEQYDRVVGAVRDLKDALRNADLAALRACLTVVVPVGIGAVLGVIGLSNLLKLLLRRAERVTVGVLLGVLLGSVLGLWPFGQSVGEKALEAASLEDIRRYAARWQLPGCDAIDDRAALVAHIVDRQVWARRTPPPVTPADALRAALMVAVGFAGTFALSRFGGAGGKPRRRQPDDPPGD